MHSPACPGAQGVTRRAAGGASPPREPPKAARPLFESGPPRRGLPPGAVAMFGGRPERGDRGENRGGGASGTTCAPGQLFLSGSDVHQVLALKRVAEAADAKRTAASNWMGASSGEQRPSGREPR